MNTTFRWTIAPVSGYTSFTGVWDAASFEALVAELSATYGVTVDSSFVVEAIVGSMSKRPNGFRGFDADTTKSALSVVVSRDEAIAHTVASLVAKHGEKAARAARLMAKDRQGNKFAADVAAALTGKAQ